MSGAGSAIDDGEFFAFDRLTGSYDAAEVARLESATWRADPLADRAVAALGRLTPGAARQVVEEGARGMSHRDAPSAFRDYLTSMIECTERADWAQIELGRRVFLRSGPAALMALPYYALPLEYSSPAGSKVLMMSGNLTGRASIRLAETGHYIAAIIEQDGLRVGGAGWAITCKVRLMHAQVRKLALASGRWDQRWRMPINQLFMAGTAMLNPCSVLVGGRRLGLRFDDEASEAVLGLWGLAAELMGVEPALIARTVDCANTLADAIHRCQHSPDADCRALVGALLDVAPHPRLEGTRAAQASQSGLVRYMIGTSRADALAVPRARWSNLLAAIAPLAAGYQRLGSFRAVSRRQEQVTERVLRRSVATLMRGRTPTYRMPQRLAVAQPTTGESRNA